MQQAVSTEKQNMYCLDKNLISSKTIVVLFFFSDSIIVSEGANTMDIGRTMLPNELPRHRLDAGSFFFLHYSVQFD